MDEEFRLRRRRVPAFGSWDFDDTEYLSYTQCFETAARPGRTLLRNSFSEHNRDPFNANDHQVFRRIRRRLICSSCERQTSIISVEPQVLIKNDKWLVNGESINSGIMKVNSRPRLPVISAVSETKAIDEDLYAISPELLRTHTTKRKKVWGIFSSCIHPKCSP
ncbi:uncharacterized protein [Henckelia pumila]|uniref:uncharacterized protein n=1 Tax=Henckelia pumila TaxID=405737 RepID=UPI003C6E284A